MRKRIILGAGQCGMKLAYEYYTKFPNGNNELLALSTSTEDSVGIPRNNLVQIATEGSGKKFSTGSNIWESSLDRLQKEFEDIEDTDIIYFVSAGGGSGSSSVNYIPELLLDDEANNRIFLVMVLPFGYEKLPFKPNTLRSIAAMHESGYAEKMSILLFDNDKLSKQYYDVEKVDVETTINTTNMEKINNHIVTSTSMVVDLINVYHDPNKFSPFTIDEIEHESVIFSNGFIGVDSRIFEGKSVNVKFDYGNINSAKNVIIAKSVGLGESDYIVNSNTGNFLEKVKKISNRAKNARIMYGIIRTDKIQSGTYIIIANNLDISKYINKIKEKTGESIEGYLSKESVGKLLTNREKNIFDI